MTLCSFFPFEKIREGQDKLIKLTKETLKAKNSLIVHAPTGIGKTVAVLAPALEVAKKKGLKIFFLTSRHTQHKIAIDTLKKIKEVTGEKVIVTDIIGKQWMCAHENLDQTNSSDFHEFCRKLVEENQCPFFNKTKTSQKPSTHATALVNELIKSGPYDVEQVIQLSKNQKMCPYEIAALTAQKSDVIICDYYYIFSPIIRDIFMKKNKLELENSVIIVDEGHNLPTRVRELLTHRLTNNVLRKAHKEAKTLKEAEVLDTVQVLQNLLTKRSEKMQIGDEKEITKEAILKAVEKVSDIDEALASLEFAADEIRETKRLSYIGSVANFLDAWRGEDEGYVRIISSDQTRFGENVTITYRCLDPSIVTKSVVDSAHSIIVMSGTLQPMDMYRDLLGFEKSTPCVALKDPFPKENRLNMIVPKTTTKFTLRNAQQFVNIAKVCANIANNIPGNTALFFPSYFILNEVKNHLKKLTHRRLFSEDRRLIKDEKEQMLRDFIDYKNSGSILLGVASANFAEGIDLPDNVLKSVVVVGLPLQKPNIEAKALIEYYDKRFGRGWDYGYLFPAFNKVLQMAGRCIRSETDKGVIAFVDERFTWPMYFRLFPNEKDVKIVREYEETIFEFFK